MKIIKSFFTQETVEVSLDEFVKKIIDDEGEYFLAYSDDEMWDEFVSLTIDFCDEEELEANKEGIMSLLNQTKDKLNKANYQNCVAEATGYIESCFEDFWDVTLNPVYGDSQEKVFRDAIKELHKKYCVNEKVE